MGAERAVRKPTTEVEGPRRLTTAQARDRLPTLAIEASIGNIETVMTNRDLPIAVIIGYRRYEELIALESEGPRQEVNRVTPPPDRL